MDRISSFRRRRIFASALLCDHAFLQTTGIDCFSDFLRGVLGDGRAAADSSYEQKGLSAINAAVRYANFSAADYLRSLHNDLDTDFYVPAAFAFPKMEQETQ